MRQRRIVGRQCQQNMRDVGIDQEDSACSLGQPKQRHQPVNILPRAGRQNQPLLLRHHRNQFLLQLLLRVALLAGSCQHRPFQQQRIDRRRRLSDKVAEQFLLAAMRPKIA